MWARWGFIRRQALALALTLTLSYIPSDIWGFCHIRLQTQAVYQTSWRQHFLSTKAMSHHLSLASVECVVVSRALLAWVRSCVPGGVCAVPGAASHIWPSPYSYPAQWRWVGKFFFAFAENQPWGRLRADVRWNLTNGQPPYPTLWRRVGTLQPYKTIIASSNKDGPHAVPIS